MFSRRAQNSSSQSFPYPSELAPSLSSPELLTSPLAATPPRGHKRSFSKPMTWLNRSSSSTSTRSQSIQAHFAPKSTRISEPKANGSRSLDQFRSCRGGPLGSGATIVRTPLEALESLSPRAFDVLNEQAMKSGILLYNTEKTENRPLARSPSSPPLPPLPDYSDPDGASRLSSTSTNVSDHVTPARSSGSPTLAPHPSPPPTLSRNPSRSLPNLLADAALAPPQPPFEAILLSPVPDGAIDSSKLIVILETCTTTYRTSLRSLTSRPSHLSRYITSLLSPASEAASVCSNVSDLSSAQPDEWFNVIFRDHLTSAGCLPRSSTTIHIFLDRPSAPYAHILTYLRSLPSTHDQPEVLPRAVQLGSSRPSLSRLESLLELRDEARYLGLVELEKLCGREIQRFHHRSVPPAPACGALGGKRTGSVHSFRTVVEVRPCELQSLPKGDGGARIPTEPATHIPRSSLSSENRDTFVRGGKQRLGIKHESGSPPPGWI